MATRILAPDGATASAITVTTDDGTASSTVATFATWLEEQQLASLLGMQSCTSDEFAHHCDQFDSITTARAVVRRFEMAARVEVNHG